MNNYFGTCDIKWVFVLFGSRLVLVYQSAMRAWWRKITCSGAAKKAVCVVEACARAACTTCCCGTGEAWYSGEGDTERTNLKTQFVFL